MELTLDQEIDLLYWMLDNLEGMPRQSRIIINVAIANLRDDILKEQG